MIFKWRSEALKNYGLGHIIVEANTIDEARAVVWNSYLEERALVDSPINAKMPWRFGDMPESLVALDDYEQSELEQWERLLKADIAADPEEIYPDRCIFIGGSD